MANAAARRRKGSSKAGRPKKEGDRYACGKLKPESFDPQSRTADGGLAERELGGRCVYVIGQAFGPQKIGIAGDVVKRLAQLQVSSPRTLSLHHWAAVGERAREVEKAVHRRLQPRWLRGEWFSVSPREAIEAIEAELAMEKAT